MRLASFGRRRDVLWVGLMLCLAAGLVLAQRDAAAGLLQQVGVINWAWAAPAMGCLVAVELAKAWRWQLLYGEQRPPYRAMLQALSLGQAASALMPIRIGDLLRLLWAAPSGEGIARGGASLALAKLIDAAILAAIVAATLGAAILAPTDLLLAALVIVGGLVALFAGVRQGQGWIRSSRQGATFFHLSRALTWLASYLHELGPRTLALTVVTSAAAWALGLLVNAAVLFAVGQPPTLDAAVRMLASGYLVALAPGPPARVGVYEAAVGGALVTAGLSLETALIAALLLHILQLLKLGLLALLATRWR